MAWCHNDLTFSLLLYSLLILSYMSLILNERINTRFELILFASGVFQFAPLLLCTNISGHLNCLCLYGSLHRKFQLIINWPVFYGTIEGIKCTLQILCCKINNFHLSLKLKIILNSQLILLVTRRTFRSFAIFGQKKWKIVTIFNWPKTEKL